MLLLFCFLSNDRNLYMIYDDSNLFYDIYNTINELNRRQSPCLPFIDSSKLLLYLLWSDF